MGNKTIKLSAVLLATWGTVVNGAEPKNYVASSPEVVVESSEPRHEADSTAPIEVVEERYPSGVVKMRRDVTRDTAGNFIMHGSWVMYSPNGSEIGRGTYLNNLRDGEWTRSHEFDDSPLFSEAPFTEFTAPFTSQATFEEGALNGKWMFFDSEQRKVSEWEYVAGKRHGTCRRWYPSGELMEEIDYRDGLKEGMHRGWDQAGQLITEDTYQQGRKLATIVEHHDDGGKASEGIYLHPQFVVDTQDDWWNGRPVTYKAEGEPKKHGRYTKWYPNGQTAVEGVYFNGLPDGSFMWRHSNGQPSVSGSYDKGERHGSWVWWHENGLKYIEGQYTFGNPSGNWGYWSESGRLTQKINYDETKADAIVDQGEESELDHQAKTNGDPSDRVTR